MQKLPLQKLFKQKKGQTSGDILFRGSMSSFGIKITGAIIGFGAQVLLARFLGVTVFGQYAFALAWLNILGMFVMLGFDTSLVRYIPEYSVGNEWSSLKGFFVRSTQIVFISSTLMSLISFSFLYFLRDHLDSEQVKVFGVAAFFLPALALNGLRQASLRGLKKIFYAEFPDRILRPLILIILLVGVFQLGGNSMSATTAMTLNGLALVVALGVGSLWLRSEMPDQVRRASATYNTSAWMKTSLPLFLIAGMHIILKRTDLVMLGAMAPADITGIYAATVRISDVVVFALASVNSILAPMISELFYDGRRHELQSILTRVARIVFAVTLLITLVLCVAGEYVLAVFGEDFVLGYSALLVLMAGLLLNSFVGSVGYLMTMTGNQRQAAVIVGSGAVLNIVLNAMLIPRYGMTGAAIATALSMVYWNLLMYLFVRVKLKINPSIWGTPWRHHK